MPSTNKTKYLKLNQWQETDRPMRNDFNSDNSIIDASLGAHLLDSKIHITAEEKAYVQKPMLTLMYAGTGASSMTVTLTESVRVIIVFAEDMPLSVYDASSSKTKSYAAFGHAAMGCSSGLQIAASADSFTVFQTEDESGNLARLNEAGVQYKVIMFK